MLVGKARKNPEKSPSPLSPLLRLRHFGGAGRAEIPSVGGKVGGFLTPTPAEAKCGKGVSDSQRVGAHPYIVPV